MCVLLYIAVDVCSIIDNTGLHTGFSGGGGGGGGTGRRQDFGAEKNSANFFMTMPTNYMSSSSCMRFVTYTASSHNY